MPRESVAMREAHEKAATDTAFAFVEAKDYLRRLRVGKATLREGQGLAVREHLAALLEAAENLISGSAEPQATRIMCMGLGCVIPEFELAAEVERERAKPRFGELFVEVSEEARQ